MPIRSKMEQENKYMQEKPITRKKSDRVLGDEWLDWNEEETEKEIREGKRTFIAISFLVLALLLAAFAVFWYLVLPRFESYGRTYTLLLTISIVAAGAAIFVWYMISLIAIYSKSNYLRFCLQAKNNIFFFLYPLVIKLANSFGISRDRLSHSFIMVSNELVSPSASEGPILTLLPRCLKRDLKKKAKELCERFPDCIIHTAPGGSEARLIIKKTSPRAIIAVACERDLVSGIHEIAPRIPVIGIPNTRPLGPCKDTSMDIDKLESALDFFSKKN